MRKIVFTLCCLVFAFVFLNGCIKDSITKTTTYTYTLHRPVYQTTAAVRANIKSNAPAPITQPGKLFIQGHYIFLNELEKGIHIIDNSDPTAPRNVAFIDIPGNVDLAVKGNTLYADLYTDLITLDISNPLAVTVTKVLENAFPHRYYGGYSYMDSTLVIVDWIKKDTTVTEAYRDGMWEDSMNGRMMLFDASSGRAVNALAASAPSAKAIGGSMARFSIVDQRLYTVGMQELKVFNIAEAMHPAYVTEKQIGFNIETIFPFQNKLFIGSASGMFIYSIANPDQPAQLSQFTHVRSCDPVIADADHAYVTLRSGNDCMGFTNQLEVLDISNLMHPSLIKTYALTNPHGLSKDGSLLFICDGAAGLKIYDASQPGNLQLLKTIGGMETYDVIAYNGRALVVAKDALYQFDYSDRNNIRQLSKLILSH